MSSQSKNEDRLSQLPEEVLSHILSSMPTKFSVRTSILSKRWRYTWTGVTNLDFKHYHYNDDVPCFSEFVDRVLKHCKTSQLNLFRFGLFPVSVQKSKVSRWINEAVRLNVCEIDIDIGPAELPISLFTCNTLTKLRLVLSRSNSNVFDISSPVIMLPALKTLDLCVSNKFPVNMMFKFIHGCLILESLSLEIMNSDINEGYYNFNIPTLKRFELRTSTWSFITKVVLNVPNLEYLFVCGSSCPQFVMEDVSSLVGATVVFHDFGYYYKKYELLKGLSGVKSLSWFISTPKEFADLPILPTFPNLKHLKLEGSFRYPWVLVIKFLESSSKLEHLCFQEPKESSWIEPQSVPTCMLTKLKSMKIIECEGRKSNIQFLEFVLGNSEVLKTLTIICGSLGMEEEMEMCARLLTIPRASRFCKIHFVGKWHKSI